MLWRVLAVMALVLVVGGIWGFNTQAVGQHITECHFDARGAYAKVRVNNLLGDGANTQQVWVNFYLPGEAEPYDGGVTSVTVPAHGRVTADVHAFFPWRALNVKGRTVYMYVKTLGLPWFVTKAYHLQHPGPTAVLTVPDDPALRCSYGGDGYD
jgi:hypothetical protein